MLRDHDLKNMIYNLEERKNIDVVQFSKNAVAEILSYLNELQDIRKKVIGND
ncbi:MAG: hypothetical protein K0Q53_136 [Massilibacillus sp.]|jgi:hypothetical protein|nr:hypothetical protein [Massilibacillus sp.]